MHPVYERYLSDVETAGDVVELVRWSGSPRVPRIVLDAHWRSETAYDMLKTLSIAHSIVPFPLAPFVADCRRRHRSYAEFLHPRSLYDEPKLARDVLSEIGRADADMENLQLLRYLAQSRAAAQYRDLLTGFLHRAFALTCVETQPWQASYVCELCVFFMNPEHVDTLDCGALERFIRAPSCARNGALWVADKMGAAAQAQVAGALAECAAGGNARACRLLQDLSHSAYCCEVAAAVSGHAHCAYVDRLALDTLWLCVPLLAASESAFGLGRLVWHDGPRAVREGVVTALVAMVKHVPDVTPALDPQTVHEAIHYIYCHQRVPPCRFLVDACMRDAPKAVGRLARRCQPLRQQMVRARSWQRRREVAMGLACGEAVGAGVLAWVQQHAFTWRLVMSWL